jgi:chromosome segregation ATPase
MKYFFIILALVLGGCKSSTPPVDIPNPPQVRPSARENIQRTQTGIDASYYDNIRLQELTKRHEEYIKAQQTTIENALKKSFEIKEKADRGEEITDEDINILISHMSKIEERNLILEKQIADIIKIVEKQNVLLAQAIKDARDAMERIVDQDREVLELRDQNQFFSKNLQNKNSEVEKLKRQNASNKMYKKIVWFIIIGYLIMFIVKNILAYAFPHLNILKRF